MAAKKVATARSRKTVHRWIKERNALDPHIVLRLDNYSTEAHRRGQFYPLEAEPMDNSKAIWPTAKDAQAAAAWAAKKFGNVYGVFRLTSIIEKQDTPVQVTNL